MQGVPTGPRSYGWIPTENATLIWAEALDGGDPRKKVTPRDKLMKIAAPFSSAPSEFVKIEHRYQGRLFGEKDGMMLFYDYNRDTQQRRIFMIDYRNPSDTETDFRFEHQRPLTTTSGNAGNETTAERLKRHPAKRR